MRVALVDASASAASQARMHFPTEWHVDVLIDVPFLDAVDRLVRAEAIVTCTLPFRRELLDYLTAIHVIVVPAQLRESLVEDEIAAQLGVAVESVAAEPGSLAFYVAAARVLAGA